MDRGLQPGRLDARPAGRALSRGRLRRVRVRAGRLDQQSIGRGAQGQASPRDNVVFEAGLFGGALGMRRTFILHAKGAKLPTDLLGMTAVRYPETLTAADMRAVNQKLRKAIEDEGRLSRLEGDWWQHSLTLRNEREPSAISLLRISRDREGGLEVAGRGWQEDGTLSVRYWSVASKEHREPQGSSTSGTASDRGTRTPRSSRALARSDWRTRIAPRDTGPPDPRTTLAARTNLRYLPARGSGRHAHPRWRDTHRAPICLPSDSRSGRRSRTASADRAGRRDGQLPAVSLEYLSRRPASSVGRLSAGQ